LRICDNFISRFFIKRRGAAVLYEKLFKSQAETITAQKSVIEAQRLQIADLEAQLRQRQ
jgi:hypothetical protein